MRAPLGTTQSVTLTHCIRQGTSEHSYTVRLSRVSVHEVNGAVVSTPGFARTGTTVLCIFPGWSTAAPEGAEAAQEAAGCFLDPEAFRGTEDAQRAAHWTLAPEDKVQLPSGRIGTVTCVQDNRTGRCPHWYVEVS